MIGMLKGKHWRGVRNAQIDRLKAKIRDNLLHSRSRYSLKSDCKLCLEFGVNQRITQISWHYIIDCLEFYGDFCCHHEQFLQDSIKPLLSSTPSLFGMLFSQVSEWGEREVPIAKRAVPITFAFLCHIHECLEGAKDVLQNLLIQSLVHQDLLFVATFIEDAQEQKIYSKMINENLALLLAIEPEVIFIFPHCSIIQDLLALEKPEANILVWNSLTALLRHERKQEDILRIRRIVEQNILLRQGSDRISIEELEACLNLLACRGLALEKEALSEWAEGWVREKFPQHYDEFIHCVVDENGMDEESRLDI